MKPTILESTEFAAFSERIKDLIDRWCAVHSAKLTGLKINDLPREVIHVLSEDLLVRFDGQPLLNRYDVYQRLMDYWAQTMQDDVYLIAADGWIEAAKPRGIVEDKERKIKETPDLTVGRKKYKMDLVPPALIVARYFIEEQAEIDALQVALDETSRELEEFVEEHSSEEGMLADALNDKGKITRASVKERLKVVEGESEIDDDERDALNRALKLLDAESEAGRDVKEAQVALDEDVLAKYGKFTEADIKTLIVQGKWFGSIRVEIEGEIQRLTQRLAARVKELEQRYERGLPALVRDVDALSETVDAHLKEMGMSWAEY